MDEITRTTLKRRLARAVEIGDHAAETMLRARLGEFDVALRRINVKPARAISETELRLLWGDR